MISEGIKRSAFHFAWLFLIVLISMQWAGVPLNSGSGWEFVPFLVSMVFLGLPHGAVDHLVPYRLKKRPLTRRSLLVFLTGYVAIGGLFGFFWWVTPAASAIFFILLTWFHWGQGEMYTVQKLIGLHKPGLWRKGLLVFVRGGLPMMVPLFAFPDVYLSFINEMIAAIGSTTDSAIAPAALQSWRLGLLILFGTAVIFYVIDGLLEANQQGSWSGWMMWLVDSAEIGLLWIFFYTISPILAVGVYFCVWHGVRHIARLMLIDSNTQEMLANGRFWSACARFMGDSAPLTAVSLLFLGGLFLFTGDDGTNLLDLTALYLVLISMLTLPHTILVCWMDYVEKVWEPWPENQEIKARWGN